MEEHLNDLLVGSQYFDFPDQTQISRNINSGSVANE